MRSAFLLLLGALLLAGAGPDGARARAQGMPAQALDSTAGGEQRAALGSARPVTARHAMVVTAQHYASEVGLRILRQGGNAVDAAVAIGYALAVVEPCCGNLGGGGFMVIHLAGGRNLFLDFREKAPLAATPAMFQDAEGNVVPGRSTSTYLAVGVPGTVLGLNSALRRYGTMSLRQVMAPAIALAEHGYVLQQGDVNVLDTRIQDFAAHPNVAAIFLNHGQPWRAGEVLRQPQLARSLRLIARHGAQAFYRGPIARALVAASEKHGGLLTLTDLADYRVVWAKPVQCGYRGYTVVSAPPPSSGGTTICEILQIIAPYPLGRWGYASVEATHYLAEAERHAFADCNSSLGDPAFVRNPVARLISSAHAARIRAGILPDRATPSSAVQGVGAATEGRHTTHYSVVDAKGNAVSVTYTINYLFGLGQMAGDTGFFLNNEMDDFTAKPGVPNTFGLVQGAANEVRPGKRPLSSMAPTIVLKRGRLFMVTGSPGGSTIISTTLESILNVVDFGMNMQRAVDAPRMHMQWYPDEIFVEPGYLTASTQAALAAMGYRFKLVPAWGAAEAILVNPVTHLLEGANDRRRPAGRALGY